MFNAAIPAPIQKLATHLLRLVQLRTELLGIELAQEIARAEKLLLIAVCATVSLILAMVLCAAFLIILFWDNHRLLVSGALALTALSVGLAALVWYRQTSARDTHAFADTWRAIKLDLDTIHDTNE